MDQIAAYIAAQRQAGRDVPPIMEELIVLLAGLAGVPATIPAASASPATAAAQASTASP